MNINGKENLDIITQNLKENLDKNISTLSYKYLNKYTEKKELISKLMSFETEKGLDEFKKQLKPLKESGDIKNETSAEQLFLDIKKVKNEISNLSKNEISKLKLSINKNKFQSNKKYDLVENLKGKNPQLYKKITKPSNIGEHIISSGAGIINTGYKTLVSAKILTSDLLKLITFQVPIEQIKEQIKRV